MTEEEKKICGETLARTGGNYALMQAEQHIINVAVGWYLWPDLHKEKDPDLSRLREAVKAYYWVLERRGEKPA